MSKSLMPDNYQHLHLKNHASTAEIAELTGTKKNTVISILRYRGVLRRAPGRDIEEEVAQWYERQGNCVLRQRGDAPYDLLINGKRVDVKSAHLSKDGSYSFAIRHDERKSLKDLSAELDYFYLVFLSENGCPIYRLSSHDISVKRDLKIHNIFNTKYPLQLLGYLRPGQRRAGEN